MSECVGFLLHRVFFFFSPPILRFLVWIFKELPSRHHTSFYCLLLQRPESVSATSCMLLIIHINSVLWGKGKEGEGKKKVETV